MNNKRLDSFERAEQKKARQDFCLMILGSVMMAGLFYWILWECAK